MKKLGGEGTGEGFDGFALLGVSAARRLAERAQFGFADGLGVLLEG